MEKCCGQALPDVLWAQGLAWALGLRRTGCAARACLADRPSAFPEAARSAMLPSCTCRRWAERLTGRVSGLWSHAASESDLGFPGAATGSDYSLRFLSMCNAFGAFGKGAPSEHPVPATGPHPWLCFPAPKAHARSPRALGRLLSCGLHSQHVCGGAHPKASVPADPSGAVKASVAPTPHQPCPRSRPRH